MAAHRITAAAAMAYVLDRIWRTLGTGFAFILFHMVCLFGGELLIGCAFAAFRDSERRGRFLQRMFQRMFAMFVLVVLRGLGLLTVEAHGFEALRTPGGRLIVANHPTLLDVVFLISRLRRVDCVVKSSLFRSVFTRDCVRAAGYIPNDDGRSMIDASVSRLALGHDVLLFPEGTRSPSGGLRVFQRGAARIALAAQCDILPVFIACTPTVLTKETKWHQVPERRPHFCLRVGAPISTARFRIAGQAQPAAVRALTGELECLFARELRRECL